MRAIIPCWIRNGSYTSSTVSGCSPTLIASVDSPTGPPPNCAAQRVEQGAVDLVEPELVDAEQRQAVAGDVGGDRAVGADLGEVADTPQEPVGDAGRAARSPGDLPGAVGVDRDAEDAGGAGDDLLQLVVVVVVEPGDEAEAVAQRAGDHARCGWWRRPA